MIPGFEALVEQRIQKAQEEGQFDNLKGANKPLKFEDENIPEEFRLAYKILKNAGFLPPEIELRKQLTRTEQLLAQTDIYSQHRPQLQKKLNYLITKINLLRGNRSFSPIATDTYRDNLLNKIS